MFSIMETERLKQFCAVVESGSLSKASEILGISISGLSKSLKTLENELGFQPLTQVGRGLVVSNDGKKLYQKAKTILDSIADLKKPHAEQAEDFKIAALEVFSLQMLGSIVSNKLREKKVHILEATPGKLEMLILNHQVDCGITYIPYPQIGLSYLKIGRFSINAFARQDVFKGKSILQIPFIVPATGLDENPMGIRERDGWPDQKIERLKTHRVNMLSTALDLARNGLGAVFIPDFVAELHNSTQKKEFHLVQIDHSDKPVKIYRDLFVVLIENTKESQEVKKLISGVRSFL